MPLYEEVLRMWRLFLCFWSYGGISFTTLKKIVLKSQQTP